MRLNEPLQRRTNGMVDAVELGIAQAIVGYKTWWGTRHLTRRIVFYTFIASERAVLKNLSDLTRKLRNV